MTAQLLVLRHGQSTWNADGRWQGQQDSPLSTLGVRQAKEAATVLGSFDLYAASDLSRATTTAEILANDTGRGPVVVDPDLRERFAGAFEGHTKVEIEQQWPGWLNAGRRPDDWEADEAVLQRAAGALGRIAATVGEGSTALVISHGGVLRVLEEAAGFPKAAVIPNLSGRWFSVGPGTFLGGDPVDPVSAANASAPGAP